MHSVNTKYRKLSSLRDQRAAVELRKAKVLPQDQQGPNRDVQDHNQKGVDLGQSHPAAYPIALWKPGISRLSKLFISKQEAEKESSRLGRKPTPYCSIVTCIEVVLNKIFLSLNNVLISHLLRGAHVFCCQVYIVHRDYFLLHQQKDVVVFQARCPLIQGSVHSVHLFIGLQPRSGRIRLAQSTISICRSNNKHSLMYMFITYFQTLRRYRV